MDTAAIVIFSGAGGAALTVVAGIVGAFFQSRREHRAWLREFRRDAYLRFLRHAHELVRQGQVLDRLMAEAQAIDRGEGTDAQRHERLARLNRDIKEEEAVSDRLGRTVVENASALWLVGPRAVEAAAQAMVVGHPFADKAEEGVRLATLEREMRRVLKVDF